VRLSVVLQRGFLKFQARLLSVQWLVVSGGFALEAEQRWLTLSLKQECCHVLWYGMFAYIAWTMTLNRDFANLRLTKML